jgi:hypothetical protein
MEIGPGAGFYLYNSGPSAFTLTFVGDVATGDLSQNTYAGFNQLGSMVPQEGLLQTDLNYQPAGTLERVYAWQPKPATGVPRYFQFNWLGPVDGWDPEEPIIGVGQSVFIYRTTGASAWTRTFNVQ